MSGRATLWNDSEIEVIQIGNLMRNKAKPKKEKQNG
jgi:hypothetical protein